MEISLGSKFTLCFLITNLYENNALKGYLEKPSLNKSLGIQQQGLQTSHAIMNKSNNCVFKFHLIQYILNELA